MRFEKFSPKKTVFELIEIIELLLRAYYSLHCNETVIASEAKQSPEIATPACRNTIPTP